MNMNKTKQKSEGFKYKNPLENPEDFDKVSTGMVNVRGEMIRIVNVNQKGVKTTEYTDAKHEKLVEMAKEMLLTMSKDIEPFYMNFKNLVKGNREIISVFMLEKYIQGDKIRLKKINKGEFEMVEELMSGFFIGLEEKKNEEK